MKRFVFLSVLFLSSATGFCQQYAVSWSKIGAGGSSTGQVYAITGTIGQPDAGLAMSGGSFSVTPGFWSFMGVVQTPGAPLLRISRNGNAVVVSWPSSASGFVLQQSSDISAHSWTDIAFAVSDDGVTRSITIPAPSGNMFFRLARQ